MKIYFFITLLFFSFFSYSYISSGMLQPAPTNQVEKAVAVPANNYWAMPLDVADTFALQGCFKVQGESENGVEMYILNKDDFENWKNGHETPTFYNSGRQTGADFNVTLGQGKYYLVLNNKFPPVSNKVVTLIFRNS